MVMEGIEPAKNNKEPEQPSDQDQIVEEGNNEDVMEIQLGPVPSVNSFRKELKQYFLLSFLIIPLSLIPAIVIFVMNGHFSFTKLIEVVIQRDWMSIISQTSIVIALTLLVWNFSQVFSILVPYLQLQWRKNLPESSYKRLSCLLSVRKFVKWTLFFLGMLIVMTRFVYDTTLLNRIVETLSKRVEGKDAKVDSNEKLVPMAAVYYSERVHICLIIFSFIIFLVKYLISSVKYTFHKVTFGKRIEQSNIILSKLAHLYNTIVSPDLEITYRDNEEVDSSTLHKITSIHFKSTQQSSVIGSNLFNELGKKKLLTEIGSQEPSGESAASPSEVSIDISDLDEYFESESEKKEIFAILKGENDEKDILSREDLSNSMVAFYQERLNIIKSLKSNALLIRKLHRILFSAGLVIAALLSTPFLDIGITTAWAGFLGLFSALSFASQSLARTCFDSMIFIFVMHSFDIGDKLVIDGDTLISEFIEVFTCHFSKLDQKGEKTLLYIPSSSLFSKTITNISRTDRNKNKRCSGQIILGLRCLNKSLPQSMISIKDKGSIKVQMLLSNMFWEHPLNFFIKFLKSSKKLY